MKKAVLNVNIFMTDYFILDKYTNVIIKLMNNSDCNTKHIIYIF